METAPHDDDDNAVKVVVVPGNEASFAPTASWMKNI